MNFPNFLLVWMEILYQVSILTIVELDVKDQLKVLDYRCFV